MLIWKAGVIGRVEWTLPNGKKEPGTNRLKGNTLKVDAYKKEYLFLRLVIQGVDQYHEGKE